MTAAYEAQVRPQVMTVVEDLAAREASGVLELTGSPSGAIYLDGGRITFARASWAPGLAVRLRAIRPELAGLGDPELAGLGEVPPGSDADDVAVARFAVQGGHLTATELHELIQSVVVDAVLVLTIPPVTEGPAPDIGFISTRTYWPELFPRLRVDLVCGEARRMAERMAEHGLAPTTAVALCDLRAPAAVLTREEWAVACQIGDRTSARDLAARQGAALADTLECLGGLTQAGLCTPVGVRGHGQPQARLAGPSRTARRPARPSAEPLPASHPAHGYLAHEHPARPERSGAPGQAPSVDILRQVLDGLRKLS